jgi:hypothetical protein
MTTSISPAAIGVTVPASSIQVIGANPNRTGLYIFNPSSVVIWVCPAHGVQSPGSPGGAHFPAVVSGAGCISIAAGTGMMLGPPTLGEFTQALNAISTTGSNPLSLWEFYP